VAVRSTNLKREGVDLGDRYGLLERLELEREPGPVDAAFPPGEGAAEARMRAFLRDKLPGYADRRSEAEADPGSWLSAHLNWGFLSPRRFAREAAAAPVESGDAAALLEELIVRRELAFNHVAYAPSTYDAFRGLPGWAVETWDAHADDPRPSIYTRRELEDAVTGDHAWNAAMERMKTTGYLHNHLRMYWGKQVPKWTGSPRYAYRILRDCNDRWLLDGNHPPTYANLLWVFGLHDRPFAEGEIRGKTRPMTRRGLERKIDLEAWPSV
jgi:deoxyribodipyrimidine photo-lyase